MVTPLPAPELKAHLEERHEGVGAITALDVNVFHVRRAGADDWVARWLPGEAGPDGDAALLRHLELYDYPAERLRVPPSRLRGGTVLVTGFVPSVPAEARREGIKRAGGFRHFGELLAQLHGLPRPQGEAARAGGGWHHLGYGGPAAEMAAARALLNDPQLNWGSHSRTLAQALGAELDWAGLPQALLHPDFVLRNAVVSPTQGLVLVDWTGAGIGPRIWSLAWLLFVAAAVDADLKRLDLAWAGYRSRIRLEREEWRALPAILPVRPAVLEIWKASHGRCSPAEAARNLQGAVAISARITERCRADT